MTKNRIENLRELEKRGALDVDLKKELYRLEQGELGEQFVSECLKEFGLDYWPVEQNLWLELFGKFECDLLLGTGHQYYTFEVKHYNGHFEYRNNQCYLNGERIGHNAISQAQKSSINFQSILTNENLQVSVQNVLVFTGEFCQVDISEQVPGLDIVMRHQLRDYIRKISQKDRGHYRGTPNHEAVMKALAKYRTTRPQFHEPISAEIFARMKTGILCKECGEKAVRKNNYNILYKCGHQERIEDALIRTVNEYCTIYEQEYVSTKEISLFINQFIHIRTIFRYLNKNYKRIGNSKATKFLTN